jgi:hypothetical protein
MTFPENMCVARALSKGIRFFMPEALGGIPIYATDEVPSGAEELSAGEGTGESVTADVDLPKRVLEIIRRAESLGVSSWANVDTWKYRVKMGGEVLNEALLDADGELDEAVPEAEVVFEDDPDAEKLTVALEEEADPPTSDSGSGLWMESTDSKPMSVSTPTSDGTAPESEAMKELLHKRSIIEAISADNADEEAEKETALTWVDEQIQQLTEESAAADPKQESLL